VPAGPLRHSAPRRLVLASAGSTTLQASNNRPSLLRASSVGLEPNMVKAAPTFTCGSPAHAPAPH
jgi:hypothetical protein